MCTLGAPWGLCRTFSLKKSGGGWAAQLRCPFEMSIHAEFLGGWCHFIEAAFDLAAEGSRVWPWGNWSSPVQKNQKRGKEKNSASKDQWSKRREQGYRRSRLGRRMGGPVWEAVEGRGNGGKSKVSWRGGEQAGRHKHEVKPFLFLWEKLLLSWVTFFSQTTALLIYWWWWWCRLWKTEQSLFYFNLS